MKWGLLPLLLFGVLSAQEADFEQLMGKETSRWIYVSKEEDVYTLEKFKKIFNTYKTFESLSGPKRIPSNLHLIWMREEALPLDNLATWVEHHPDWTINLWTDREVIVKGAQLNVRDARDYPFLFSREQFDKAQSGEEREELFLKEVLYKEGGVAALLDTKCLKPFDPLANGYDFFCGLNYPHTPLGGRNISAVREVIGSAPFHPVIGMQLRSKTPFLTALSERLEEDNHRDIVLPASYFADAKGYALVPEAVEEEQFFRVLGAKPLTSHWGALSLNLAAVTGAWIYFVRRRRKKEE